MDVAVGGEWNMPVMAGEGEAAGMALGGVGECDEDVPRCGDREKDDGAGDGSELADAGEDGAWVASSQGEVCEDDEDRKDDTDQALSEDIESAGASEGPAEKRMWIGVWRRTAFGEPVAVEGEGEPKADHRIRDEDTREDEDAEAGEEDEASVESCSQAVEGVAGEGFEDEC